MARRPGLVAPRAPVEPGWSDSSEFKNDHVGCDEEFLACAAVELALKLLGQYLYCHQSGIVVLILEIKAYPDDDAEVCNAIFYEPDSEGNLRLKFDGGMIIACQRDGSEQAVICIYDKKPRLYITAGKAGSGDVVLFKILRTHEGLHLIEDNRKVTSLNKPANKNILIDPHKVSEWLGWQLGFRSVLYEESGIQLLLAIPDETKERVICETH